MRIVSGINPSSAKGLHLGNYLGAVRPFLELQEKHECYYFVANLHALNTVFDPRAVKDNTAEIFLEYLSFGIDPAKCVFFVESDIPEITYLQTILNNCVTVGELQRMHGYKDKLAKDVDPGAISAGLFEYPVLMAADILAFAAEGVPVGEDQVQHVEICREIGRTFDQRYGQTLTIPEVIIHKEVARVRGTDGVRKMSKSLGNDLPIFATDEEIRRQIMSITTDPARIRPTDPGDPKKNVCFDYLRFLNYPNNDIIEMEEKYRQGTIGDVAVKKILLEVFLTYVRPYQTRRSQLSADQDYLLKVRQTGMNEAREIAADTLQRVQTAVGL